MISQIVFNSIAAGSLIALTALGFGLVHKVAGFFHFAHGALMTLAGYIVYVLVDGAGLPKPISVCAAVLASGICGALLDFFIYRRLRSARASSMALLLASLGIYVVMQNGISAVFGDQSLALRSWSGEPAQEYFGVQIQRTQLLSILGSWIAISLFALLLKASALGRSIRAVGDDGELAKAAGIRVDWVITWCFFLGSALAALSAVLTAFDAELRTTLGFRSLLFGACGYILGGVGSLWGAVVGGLLVGLIQHFSNWLLPTQWQDCVIFAVLALVLLFLPGGIVGRHSKKASI